MSKAFGPEIGVVIGETTPFQAIYLSYGPPRLGEYVVIEHPEGPVLGMVEESIIGNAFLPDDAKDIRSALRTIEMIGDERLYLKGKVKILSRLEDLIYRQKVKPVKTPPKPGAKVYLVDEETLRGIFTPRGSPILNGEAVYEESTGRGYVRIGALANNPSVPVYVDVTKMVARHTAILAMTGAGKSNTVAVLADRISKAFKGTVVLFDFHGEYIQAFPGADVNLVTPRINPNSLKLSEIATLANIQTSYHKQYRVLRLLYDIVYRKLGQNPAFRGKNLIELMVNIVDKVEEYEEAIASSPERGEKKKKTAKKPTRESVAELASKEFGKEASDLIARLVGIKRDYLYEVAGKLEDLLLRYRTFLNTEAPQSVDSLIVPGKLNVVDLSQVDREGSDVFVAFVTRTILEERKKYVTTGGQQGYGTPVFLILEEAHILVPRDEETNTKSVFSQVAREGRKFGVGICLVSQRPKNLDENSLSQTNNKIILRLIEPEDQKYVQRTSEQLSNELLGLLTSLDVGEAILLGEFTMLPTLVKIDEYGYKTMGRDPEVVREWVKKAGDRSAKKIDLFDEFNKMQYGL